MALHFSARYSLSRIPVVGASVDNVNHSEAGRLHLGLPKACGTATGRVVSGAVDRFRKVQENC